MGAVPATVVSFIGAINEIRGSFDPSSVFLPCDDDKFSNSAGII
jgi:hypothetical protein